MASLESMQYTLAGGAAEIMGARVAPLVLAGAWGEASLFASLAWHQAIRAERYADINDANRRKFHG